MNLLAYIVTFIVCWALGTLFAGPVLGAVGAAICTVAAVNAMKKAGQA